MQAWVDSPMTGWKDTEDGTDEDEYVALLGSWHTEAWAERQQRERFKQAMQALEEGGAAVLMERIPAVVKGYSGRNTMFK